MSGSASIQTRSKSPLRIGLITTALGAAACSGDSMPSTGPSSSSGGTADRVKVEGGVSGRAGACPTIRFILGGITVETTATTDFELPCNEVVNGKAIEADGRRMTGLVLVAREVDADDDASQEPEFETEGPVESVSATADCSTPAGRSVTVLGLRFGAGSFTRFRDISEGCSGLAVGMRVRARGALGNPSALRAAEVERRQP